MLVWPITFGAIEILCLFFFKTNSWRDYYINWEKYFVFSFNTKTSIMQSSKVELRKMGYFIDLLNILSIYARSYLFTSRLSSPLELSKWIKFSRVCRSYAFTLKSENRIKKCKIPFLYDFWVRQSRLWLTFMFGEQKQHVPKNTSRFF